MKAGPYLQIALLITLTFGITPLLRAQNCPSLLVNGDFESSGGFTSDYRLGFNNLMPGEYAMTSNAYQFSPYFINMQDHTSGSGRYMAVNGDDHATKSFWKATVAVKKGVTYAFSVWISNLHIEFLKAQPDTINSAQPAKFQFIIDGQPLIKVNTRADNQWRQYVQFYTFTKDAAVEITLMNNANPRPSGGNDFALDDIFFGETCVVTGSDDALTNAEVFGVYPNPVRSGMLYFGKTARSFSLVSVDNVVMQSGTNAPSISTAGLAKGIYFLHLENNKYKVLIE